MRFDDAFDALISHEGVLSMNAQDRGNWSGGQVGQGELKGTKYGISAASYPDEDILHLTLERAKFLYRRDYWLPIELLPPSVRFDVFDMAVNSGVRKAVETLQEAVESPADGILGPVTYKAVAAMPPARVRARFNGCRLEYLADLTSWPAFSRGWARRIAKNLKAI
jgi:lysozyme family protein